VWLVKKEPRRVEMLVGRAALEVLHETYAGVRRARAKRTLVLDRRTPGAQVRVGSESGLGRSGHQIRLLELVELDGNLLVLRAVVAKIWIIGEPSHAVPVHGVPLRKSVSSDSGDDTEWVVSCYDVLL